MTDWDRHKEQMHMRPRGIVRQLAEAHATVVAAQGRIEELEAQLDSMRDDLADARRRADRRHRGRGRRRARAERLLR